MEESYIKFNPLVSICIPAYNAYKYLKETLDCLVNQDYNNIEIIVVDDNSTDDTWEYLEKYSNDKVHILRSANKGAAACRNQAFRLSKGEYIVFFDADDLVDTNFISSQLCSIVSNDEVSVSKWGRFYQNNVETFVADQFQVQKDLTFKEWIISYWCNNRHMTCPGRVFMARKLVEKAGLWDEDLNLNDDFPFYVRVFSVCSIIRFDSNSSFYYRSGINGLSSKKGITAYCSLYKAISRGIDVALQFFYEDIQVRRCCANLLQAFIYSAHPFNEIQIELAEKKIISLGGANFAFPAGGKTKFLLKFMGWRTVKKLKLLLGV